MHKQSKITYSTHTSEFEDPMDCSISSVGLELTISNMEKLAKLKEFRIIVADNGMSCPFADELF